MANVYVCDECDGRGLQTYERGPAVERCAVCSGLGVRFLRPAHAARDFRDVITGTGGLDLSVLGDAAVLRILAALAADLEQRVEELERDSAGSD